MQHSRSYYRVRTLVRVLFWGGLAVALFIGSDHINWMGDHYCFRSSLSCYGMGK